MGHNCIGKISFGWEIDLGVNWKGVLAWEGILSVGKSGEKFAFVAL